MDEQGKVDIEQLAEAHVDWLLSTMRPLMVQEFIHGYSHGFSDGRSQKEVKVPKNYSKESRVYPLGEYP